MPTATQVDTSRTITIPSLSEGFKGFMVGVALCAAIFYIYQTQTELKSARECCKTTVARVK